MFNLLEWELFPSSVGKKLFAKVKLQSSAFGDLTLIRDSSIYGNLLILGKDLFIFYETLVFLSIT